VTEYSVAVGEDNLAHDTSVAAAFVLRSVGAFPLTACVADVISLICLKAGGPRRRMSHCDHPQCQQ